MILEIAQAAQPGFWDRLAVAAAGPLISSVVGTGIIGLIILKVTHRTQDRRTERELRRELLTTAMKTASALYLATQNYWRAKNSNDQAAKDEARKLLDTQYLECRAQALFLEGQFEAVFGDTVAIEWHKVDDLLTVRYMQLTDNDKGNLYKKNAKGYDDMEHSGLSEEELRNPKVVLDAYRAALKTVAGKVMTAALRTP